MKKKLAMMFYSIGCFAGHLYLFYHAMRQAGKHFREFEKLVNEIKKEEKRRGK